MYSKNIRRNKKVLNKLEKIFVVLTLVVGMIIPVTSLSTGVEAAEGVKETIKTTATKSGYTVGVRSNTLLSTKMVKEQVTLAETDTTKPVVTLTDANGNVVVNKQIIDIEINSEFDLDTAIVGTAVDETDGELDVTRGAFIRFGETPTIANSGDNAGKVDVSTAGYYLVKYQACDNAGNLTTVSVYFHVVDTTKPVVQMTYNGVELKTNDMIQVEAGSDFTLSDIDIVTTDNGIISTEAWSEKTIRYSTNLEDVASAGFSAIDTNKQGYYLAKYVASDSALDDEGNSKPNSTYFSVYIHVVDTVEPVINGIENNQFYNKDVTYSIDEKFLDYVVINGVKYSGDEIPYTLTEEGTYVIKAVDTVGNESIEYTITIDKTAPTYNPEQWSITVEVNPNSPTPYLDSETVKAIIDEQLQYIYDEHEVSVYEDTWWNQNASTLDVRKVGTYANAFSFYIKDAAGNAINPRITVKVVDTTAPTYTIEYSTTDYTYDTVTVTVTASEEVVNVPEGWTLDETKTVLTKTFAKNATEEITLTDAYGNSTNVTVEVSNITDKQWLESFVQMCSELDSTKYSEVTWNNFYPVYEEAVEMLNVGHSQDEVDEMYARLITAYLNLRLVPDGSLID